MALRPINSVKNILDGTALGTAAGVTTNFPIINTVNDYTGLSLDVPIGAKVSSVYLFFQIIAQAAAGVVDAFVYKAPKEVSDALLATTPGATGGSLNRKYILHEEKGIPGIFNQGAPPHTFRGVIRIPRGRQRMGEQDQMQLRVRCSTAYDACYKAIYKFYQ